MLILFSRRKIHSEIFLKILNKILPDDAVLALEPAVVAPQLDEAAELEVG